LGGVLSSNEASFGVRAARDGFHIFVVSAFKRTLHGDETAPTALAVIE
jgi:hypothetical protein